MRMIMFAAAAALLMAEPALAQRDAAIDQARASGIVGEQADGYLGFVPGAQISADLRSRVEQNNMRRRAAYTRRAEAANATASEIGAAVACEVFQDEARLRPGERYRDAQGVWRQRAAGQLPALPAYCG
jgi:uncharacterized protein YdbL (DUF1318 family)